MNNINDLKKQFESLIKQGQELLEKMKENHIADANKKVRWKPVNGQDYYAIWSHGFIGCYTWGNGKTDNSCFKIGNCFKTEEEAQKELNRRLAEQELLDLCDYKDGAIYQIHYDKDVDEFNCDWFDGVYTPYRFASRESAQKAIDTLGTEKLKLIFRID